MRYLSIVATIIYFLINTTTAFADKRVALVIGNMNYINSGKLTNPLNDANDIAQVLGRLNFEVILGLDLDLAGMRNTLKEFNRKTEKADTALLFYAGHALQVKGKNYLLPIDTKLDRESDLELQAYSLGQIRRQMEGTASTLLIFLDACRNNPFARSFKDKGRTAGFDGGLAEPTDLTSTFISFSTQPGNIALDGTGRNSPFTASLLAHIELPGINIVTMATRIRADVYNKTNGDQLPWANSGMLKEYYLNGSKNPTSDNLIAEKQAWDKIKSSENIEDVLQFQKDFKGGAFSSISETRLKQLEQLQKIETASLNDQPEQIPVAKINKILESEEQNLDEIPSETLVRSFQNELTRIGCDPGTVDGKWGRKGQNALRRFTKFAKIELSSLTPSQEILDKLKQKNERICPLICGVQFINKNNKCVLKVCATGKQLSSKGICFTPQKPANTSTKKKTVKTATQKIKTVKAKPTSGQTCFEFNGEIVCD